MLTAAWLGVLPLTHEGVITTARHLRQHHWYGGGVFTQGGAHPAATALLMGILSRLEPGKHSPLLVVSALASSTGAFPSARHPERGALGEGDDLLGAAMFLLLALDGVQADRRTLRITSAVRRAHNLPTPFGRIDIADGRVVGRWWGPAPDVVIEVEPEE